MRYFFFLFEFNRNLHSGDSQFLNRDTPPFSHFPLRELELAIQPSQLLVRPRIHLTAFDEDHRHHECLPSP
jgi:hypothetical protein